MGISWGLETRVRELFAIECLSCSLLPPQKNQKIFFQKSESQEIPDTKLKKSQEKKYKKKIGKRTTQRRNIHKSSLRKKQKKPGVGNPIPLTF